jgi:hypothetical protein
MYKHVQTRTSTCKHLRRSANIYEDLRRSPKFFRGLRTTLKTFTRPQNPSTMLANTSPLSQISQTPSPVTYNTHKVLWSTSENFQNIWIWLTAQVYLWHTWNLKLDTLVIVLQNLNMARGVCNGTRKILTQIRHKVSTLHSPTYSDQNPIGIRGIRRMF